VVFLKTIGIWLSGGRVAATDGICPEELSLPSNLAQPAKSKDLLSFPGILCVPMRPYFLC
jgi:hypothetical protein